MLRGAETGEEKGEVLGLHRRPLQKKESKQERKEEIQSQETGALKRSRHHLGSQRTAEAHNRQHNAEAKNMKGGDGWKKNSAKYAELVPLEADVGLGSPGPHLEINLLGGVNRSKTESHIRGIAFKKIEKLRIVELKND